MNNTRFATAVHILTLLSIDSTVFRSSEWIAGSINVNPVVVRRELSVLKSVGLVESKQGKEGGVRLAKESKNITLSEIYLAVQSCNSLGKKNQNPNPNCYIGRNINNELTHLFDEVQDVLVEFLKGKTLKAFSENFN